MEYHFDFVKDLGISFENQDISHFHKILANNNWKKKQRTNKEKWIESISIAICNSHFCGCSFYKFSIYTSVGSLRNSNSGITSRFNIVGGRSGSWWWIIDTEILTLNGEMLMCQVWVKILYCRKELIWETYKWDDSYT
jgi:hypothetical protein